jgi:hypothetical protein
MAWRVLAPLRLLFSALPSMLTGTTERIPTKDSGRVETNDLLSYDLSDHRGATVVRPTGRLDTWTYGELRDTLLKCAADEPRAVIVDLEALEIVDDYLVGVFVAVWMRIAQWSPMPLMLVPGHGNAAVFQTTAGRRFLSVYTSVSMALEHLDTPPSRRRTVLWLPPSPHSVLPARQFVGETCRNWRIETMTADAVAVAAELVANVASHAHSPARLRLESWSGRLTVAVADDDPTPVCLPPTGEATAAGGLGLVARLARVCGCSPMHSGGKVVWAVLSGPADHTAVSGGTAATRFAPR